jgi:hypothetical protein
MARTAERAGRCSSSKEVALAAFILVFQAHSRKHGPAGERDAESVNGECGENEQEKERGSRVPGRGVRRQRELQEVMEIISEDECEEPEAEKDEDQGGGPDEAESPGDQPAAFERHRHDQSEGSGGQPFFSEDRPQEEEEQSKPERKEHGHRRPANEVVGDGSGTAESEVPWEGRNRRRRLEGAPREVTDLAQDGPENADQRAGEQNSPHQRVGEASREAGASRRSASPASGAG